MQYKIEKGFLTKQVKVTVNKYGKIILDGTIYGGRHRFSTRKKATLLWKLWYILRAKYMFLHYYNQTYGKQNYQNITFKEYGNKIIENTQKDRNTFTQKSEISKFKVLCKTFGKMKLSDIRASHILIWQNQHKGEPKTIVNYRTTLNKVFKYAVYDEIMKNNPLQVVKAPTNVQKEVQVFSEEELTILLNNSKGQLKNIILFTAFTGVRAGELIGLKWIDIDFERNTITIQRRIREGNIDVPKSKRTRTLDMLPQSKDALKSQFLLTKDKEYIFISKSNTYYKRANKISASIRRICRISNIEEGTLQTLRRTCNTLYKQYNLPNDWILDQLGHMEDAVNRKHYTGKLVPDLSRIGTVLSE